MNSQILLSEVENATRTGCKIISFCYRTKTSGETSLYKVLLGVNLINAYKRDIKIASRLKLSTDTEKRAREEIVQSLKDSLNRGIGNNPRYTQTNLYHDVTSGIRRNVENGDLHLCGFVLNRTVINKGKHKQYRSSEITLAKKNIKKKLKSDRFRDFVLAPECISGLKVRGHILEFHNTKL